MIAHSAEDILDIKALLYFDMISYSPVINQFLFPFYNPKKKGYKTDRQTDGVTYRVVCM